MPMPRRTTRELHACAVISGHELFLVVLEWLTRARAEIVDALVMSGPDTVGRLQGAAQKLDEIIAAFDHDKLAQALEAVENNRVHGKSM